MKTLMIARRVSPLYTLQRLALPVSSAELGNSSNWTRKRSNAHSPKAVNFFAI